MYTYYYTYLSYSHKVLVPRLRNPSQKMNNAWCLMIIISIQLNVKESRPFMSTLVYFIF